VSISVHTSGNDYFLSSLKNISKEKMEKIEFDKSYVFFKDDINHLVSFMCSYLPLYPLLTYMKNLEWVVSIKR